MNAPASKGIAWKRQGAAVVGALDFVHGARGNVVLVGPASNPKGAALLVPDPESGKTKPVPLGKAFAILHPRNIIEILCMQERVFGSRGLPPPAGLS